MRRRTSALVIEALLGAVVLVRAAVGQPVKQTDPTGVRSERPPVRSLSTDLVLVSALAVACAALAILLPSSWIAVRTPPALALVLVLPGYALASGGFDPGELRTVERVLLSLALSIACTILVALALDALTVRLTAGPWLGAIAALTVLAAAIGQTLGHARRLRAPRFAPRAGTLILAAVAVVLLCGAAVLGFTPLGAPAGTAGTTALWLLPRSSGAVEFGVISGQLHRSSYFVEIHVAGSRAQRFGPITLRSGGCWSGSLATGRGTPRVTATLFRVGAPGTPYRYGVLDAGWLVPRAAAAKLRCGAVE